MLPSVFVLFWLRHAYVQKIPGSPRDTYSRSGRAWERGYRTSMLALHAKSIPEWLYTVPHWVVVSLLGMLKTPEPPIQTKHVLFLFGVCAAFHLCVGCQKLTQCYSMCVCTCIHQTWCKCNTIVYSNYSPSCPECAADGEVLCFLNRKFTIFSDTVVVLRTPLSSSETLLPA